VSGPPQYGPWPPGRPPYGFWPSPPPRRRTSWGLILGLVGLLVAVVLLVWPVRFSVLGTTVDCGSGLTAWDTSPNEDDATARDLADRCQADGKERLLIVALIVGVSGVLGFGVTLAERHD
jgi:hypothetical protein